MNKYLFIFRSLIRGIIFLAIILAIYLTFKRFVKIDYVYWLEPVFDKEGLMYTIFLLSEIIIGIIPPELYMIWALRFTKLPHFILVVTSLSVISYIAGITGFFIGRYLNTTIFYRYIRLKFLKKMEKRLQYFGLYLIVIASLTPIPFSGTAMLVGSVKYSFPKYLFFSLFRFLRFGIYAYIFWKVNGLV